MPYVRNARKRPSRRPSTRPRKTAYRKAAKRPQRRRPAVTAGKPVGRAVFRPEQPQTQKGYLPFSNSFNVRLPWVWATGFSAPGSQVSGITTYRLNGPYDPDYSTGGHQPQQWDQISGLYGRYFVHAAKFTLEFSNPTADGLWVGYGIRFTGDGGAFSGLALDVLSEKRNVVMKPILNTGSQKVTYSQYVPLHQVFGLPKIIYNADRASFGAAINTVPSKEVWITPIILDSTGGTTQCHMRLSITYYATMYEAIWQAQS